jgi:hypothetical protein
MKKTWIPLFLIIFTFGSTHATMIGDFSPMKVGNKWVYSDLTYTLYYDAPLGQHDSLLSEKTIKITAMDQHGDSLFYMIFDSTIAVNCPSCVPITHKKTYLRINNNNLLYDTSAKIFAPVESLIIKDNYTNDVFCNHSQIPDSILIKVPFLSQSLYSFSIDTLIGSGQWFHYQGQWIQNYGLVYFTSNWGGMHLMSTNVTELKLISFNDQSIGVIAPKNKNRPPSGNLIYADTHKQIHWRGLSATDRLGVQLFDFRGKLLYFSRQLPGISVLKTSQFSSGAYILRFQVNNGAWYHYSFVIN